MWHQGSGTPRTWPTILGAGHSSRETVNHDDLPKHLALIQAVIERHAQTSLLLKGWCVTLVVAVFLPALRGNGSREVMTLGLLHGAKESMHTCPKAL